ncbi:putative terpene synthase 11, partial [Bienertia sinuspersici]
MGLSESDSSKCRRHPNQRQIPGVCSSCLREKLTKLSNSPSFNRRSTHFISYSSSASTSPPYSTASSSSATTVTRKSPGTTRHRRNGSEAYVSVGMVLNDGLKKSRSVSCAPLSKTKLIGANMDCISNEK